MGCFFFKLSLAGCYLKKTVALLAWGSVERRGCGCGVASSPFPSCFPFPQLGPFSLKEAWRETSLGDQKLSVLLFLSDWATPFLPSSSLPNPGGRPWPKPWFALSREMSHEPKVLRLKQDRSKKLRASPRPSVPGEEMGTIRSLCLKKEPRDFPPVPMLGTGGKSLPRDRDGR